MSLVYFMNLISIIKRAKYIISLLDVHDSVLIPAIQRANTISSLLDVQYDTNHMIMCFQHEVTVQIKYCCTKLSSCTEQVHAVAQSSKGLSAEEPGASVSKHEAPRGE